MFKKSIFYLLTLSLLLAVPAGLGARITSTNYIIFADVFSAGGTEDSSSSNYGLQDTLGEAIILSATSTSANYGIKAGFRELYPDQFITFSANPTTVDLGTLSNLIVSTASNTLTVDTNSINGFSITVSGATLTSTVGDTISAIGVTSASSTAATEQFGINLVANTAPSVGAAASGTAPIGSAAAQYDTADSFAYNTGDTIASSAGDINQTVFTVSYIGNISLTTELGSYTTTLTYSATANF